MRKKVKLQLVAMIGLLAVVGMASAQSPRMADSQDETLSGMVDRSGQAEGSHSRSIQTEPIEIPREEWIYTDNKVYPDVAAFESDKKSKYLCALENSSDEELEYPCDASEGDITGFPESNSPEFEDQGEH